MSRLTRRRWLQTFAVTTAGLVWPACSRRAPVDPDEFDVCVVGSGPAGTAVAVELIRRGIRTILLEGGPFSLPSAASGSSEPDTFPTSRTGPHRYPIGNTRFLGTGGTSNLWAGRCPRLQPMDFDVRNPSLPAGVTWPITYEDVAPYYDRAERLLDVRGGPASRFAPPRSAELPGDGRVSPCLQAVLSAGGWTLESAPTSGASRMRESHLPAFQAAPAGRFIDDARVVRILTAPGGSVSGVETRDAAGGATIRARFYVLACGGIETPRLLQYSRSPEFPAGIGNGTDQVGRHFMEHIGLEIGTIRLGGKPGCATADIEETICWQFYDEFKRLGMGAAIFELAWLPSEQSIDIRAVVEMKAEAANRVTLAPAVIDEHGSPVAALWVALGDEDRRACRHAREIGSRIAASVKGARYVAGADEAGWCHHHMGTCRMGHDPQTSVVDADLKVHGSDNLYVAGSAPFVTGGVGSPTLLLTALSIRLADHLATRLRPTADRKL